MPAAMAARQVEAVQAEERQFTGSLSDASLPVGASYSVTSCDLRILMDLTSHFWAVICVPTPAGGVQVVV